MISVPVLEPSRVADVRRQALAIAAGLGFGDVAAGRVGIVTVELATNLVKFASGGELLLGVYEDDIGPGVELIALDKGPGVSDVAAILSDGFSTAGSAGTGLGAIRRLCDTFDIVSWPRIGTAILARVGGRSAASPTAAKASAGQVIVPIKGETVCGDAVCVRPHRDGWTVLVADGLGHGPLAAQASNEAVRIFRSLEGDPLLDILAAIHQGIRHTRGAAVAICRYSATDAAVRYAGLGNIEGRIMTGAESKRLVSHAGTAGVAMRRMQEFNLPFAAASTLVMHSDGLTTSWALSAHPGVLNAHPALTAAVLYHHFQRGRDDASVVVATGSSSRAD